MRHPLADIDHKVLKAALVDMAKTKAAEFPTITKKLFDLLREHNPLCFLATLASYGLTGGVSSSGVQKRSKPLLEQHHIELLHAIILTIPEEELGETPPPPQATQDVIDALKDVAEAFTQRRYLAMEEERNDQERTALMVQEAMRMHTQLVRNWSHFSDVTAISLALYSPLDEKLRAALGFTATDVLAVACAMVRMLEVRTNDRWQRLRRVFRERTVRHAVKAYYKAYPQMEGDPEDLIAHFGSDAPLDYAKATILAHSDLVLVTASMFMPNDIAKEVELPVEVVENVLASLSQPFGALSGVEIERLFMGNATWRAPVIKLSRNYFCSMPQVIFSHIHDVMKALCEKANLKEALEKRRAAYLEDAVHKLLLKALPGAKLWQGVKWTVAGQEFETDHIVLLDRTLLIFEDKSAALTEPGLRGAPDRLKKHIRELILAPSEQSFRLQNLIENARAGDAEAIRSLEPVGLQVAEIDQIFRLSVTLDDISVISSEVNELKKAGLIPHDSNLAATIGIADLGVVADITDRPHLFVHYLSQRSHIQQALHIFADEVDFLGFYLTTLFNVAGMEKEDIHLTLTGMSEPVDHYYNSADAGVTVPKPRPKLSSYIRRVLDTLERRRPPRWLSMALAILNSADYEEQLQIEKMLGLLPGKVRKNWRDPAHECSVVCTPPDGRDVAIAYFAYPSQLQERRKELAGNLAESVLEKTGKPKCLIIARNIDRWDEAVFLCYDCHRY